MATQGIKGGKGKGKGAREEERLREEQKMKEVARWKETVETEDVGSRQGDWESEVVREEDEEEDPKEAASVYMEADQPAFSFRAVERMAPPPPADPQPRPMTPIMPPPTPPATQAMPSAAPEAIPSPFQAQQPAPPTVLRPAISPFQVPQPPAPMPILRLPPPPPPSMVSPFVSSPAPSLFDIKALPPREVQGEEGGRKREREWEVAAPVRSQPNYDDPITKMYYHCLDLCGGSSGLVSPSLVEAGMIMRYHLEIREEEEKRRKRDQEILYQEFKRRQEQKPKPPTSAEMVRQKWAEEDAGQAALQQVEEPLAEVMGPQPGPSPEGPQPGSSPESPCSPTSPDVPWVFTMSTRKRQPEEYPSRAHQNYARRGLKRRRNHQRHLRNYDPTATKPEEPPIQPQDPAAPETGETA
jgi:hypothetical protein